MRKVTIYALTTCLWCKKTKKFFEEKGFAYEAIEYDKLDDAKQAAVMQEIKRCGGTGSFPFVQIDGACVQGYDPVEFEKLLEKK